MSLWKYVGAQPAPALLPWVASYAGYTEKAGRFVNRLEVAQEQAILIIGFGEPWQVTAPKKRTASTQLQLFVAGIQTAPLLVGHSGSQRCIEIKLHPWAMNRLLIDHSIHCFDVPVDLSEIWKESGWQLVEQLNKLKTWPERFAQIDQFLIQQISKSDYVARAELKWAWQQLKLSGGRCSIRQLSQTLGWSEKHLSRCFHQHIGITPKAAARRIRFASASQQLMESDNRSLSDIAFGAGYSDQSHFTREFRQFSGTTPLRYRRARFADLPGTSAGALNET